MGFGDSLTFMFLNYRKIKNNDIHIFNYINFTKDISNFLFGEKRSLSLYPNIPLRIYYSFMDKYGDKFYEFSNFKKIKYDFDEWETNKNLKYSFNRLIRVKLKRYKFDKSILPKKYICMNLKYFNESNRNFSTSTGHIRQVTNLRKFIEVFNFLKKKKISLIITNNQNEKIYKIIKKMKKNNKLENILFLNDFFKYPNFINQCHLAINSMGYLGSDSGPQVLYCLLNKKTVSIDGYLEKPGYYRLYEFYTKNFKYRFIPNKIKIDNKIHELDLETLKKLNKEKQDYFLVGCSAKEIINVINYFLIK